MLFGITMIIYELTSSPPPPPLICKYLCLYCSFVGSGYRERDVYCIYEDEKKKISNVKKKKSVIIKKKKLMSS